MQKKISWIILGVGIITILASNLIPAIKQYEMGVGYAWIHTFIEGLTIIAALFAAYESLNYFRKIGQKMAVFLSFIFLSYAVLNVLHIFSFGGMPQSFIFPSANLSVMIGVLAKTILAAGLIFAAWIVFLNRKNKIYPLGFAAGIVFLAILFVSIFNVNDPEFVTIYGSTVLNFFARSMVFAMFLVAGFLYCKFAKMKFMVFPFMNFILLMLISEAALFSYSGTYYINNLIGHIFKGAGFIALVIAVAKFRKQAYLEEAAP